MANIAINSVATRVQYVASGSQTTFSYTFPIKEDADLKVYKRAADSTPSDAADLLTLTTDYTVTGANTASGGTIVLVTGATAGDIVTIVGDKAIDRTAIYDQSVTLKKSDLNNDFNDNVMYDKQIDTEVQQLGLRYNRSERITPSNREDNLKLPILNDNEMWIGRGNSGDSPDDVTTVLVSTLTGLVLNSVDYVIGTAEDLLPNAQVLGSLSNGLLKNSATGGTGTVSIASAGTDYYAPGGTDVALADGGTGASLSNPGADRIFFWDNSASSAAFLTVGSGLTITDTTITASNNGDVVGPASATDNAVVRFDGTTGKLVQNSSVIISDADAVSGVTQLDVDNLRLDGNTVSSTNTDGDINLTPNGAGNVVVDARGLDVNPGSDTDADLITVGVTGAPTISWAESADRFEMNNDLSLGTSATFTTGNIELGDATDTTLSRASAGDMNIEGNIVYRAGGTDVPLTDGGTGASTNSDAIDNLVSGATISTATVATDDKILIQDTDDSDNLKTVTAQSIADLSTSGQALTVDINQTSHGLSTGDIVRLNGTDYVAAQANSESNAEVVGIVSSVDDSNNFTLLYGGYDSDVGSFTAGELYYLSPSSAGDITSTRPTGSTEVVKPVLIADSSTGAYFINQGHVPVVLDVASGGTGASSQTAYAVLCGGTTGTGAFQSIASVGTSGQVLTSNGAGALPTFQATGADAGLVLLATATASSSATVDFDNQLDGTYDQYILTVDGCVPATDGVGLYLRVGTGATPTYQSGASDYRWTFFAAISNTAADFANLTDEADSEIEISQPDIGSAAGESYSASFYISDPSNTSVYTHIYGSALYDRDDNLSTCGHLGGVYLATTAVTSLRILASSGNIASGEFKLYGRKRTT